MSNPTEAERLRALAALTEAQRLAVTSAIFCRREGVWHPEGWYFYADRRVRYALALKGLASDYLCPRNRLTPLGLQVRAALNALALERGEKDHG